MRTVLLAVSLAVSMAASSDPASAQTLHAGSAGDCERPRTMTAVVQALGVNFVVNRIDDWVFDEEWARVDFESWSRNLRLGWEWDENAFDVNMFLHPYHGSLYFDAARANCLGFWSSVPIAFLGSWTWEYFGETFRPSLNDFFMTGFGGVAIGEMLHQASTAVLDLEAEGTERFAREAAALALNPLRGLNRLVRGEWTRQGTNPANRIPDAYLFAVKTGARRVRDNAAFSEPIYSPTLLVELALGDPMTTPHERPFDVVRVLSQVSPDGGGLNIFRAVGRLYGGPVWGSEPGSRHRFLVNQRFDYVSNPLYHFGEQSLHAALASRWPIGVGDLSLRTMVTGDLIMMGAIDAPVAGFGERTNDFGPGAGAALEFVLERDGRTWASLYNRFRYLHSVSGAPADHRIFFSGLDVTIPVTDQLSLGTYLSGDRRTSTYTDLPDDRGSYFETRIYATWTIANRAASGGDR